MYIYTDNQIDAHQLCDAPYFSSFFSPPPIFT
jgi:hypothetical protein